MYKKIALLLGMILFFMSWWIISITNAGEIAWQSLNLQIWNNWIVNSSMVDWLKQENYNYKVQRHNIFDLWHIIWFNTLKWVVEFYYIKDKTHYQFIWEIQWYNLTKLWNKFSSNSFIVENWVYKYIYELKQKDTGEWYLYKIWEILDPNFTPLEYKQNVLVWKETWVIKNDTVCASTNWCNDLQQSNPDFFSKLTCEYNEIWEKECKAIYKWDIVYAYSVINQTKPFSLVNALEWKITNITYDWNYKWWNYAKKFNFDYPIKINWLFLSNINTSIPWIKYYNIISNVNWINKQNTGSVNQIVMYSIKVYDNNKITPDMFVNDNIKTITWNLLTGNTLYNISDLPVAKYFNYWATTIQKWWVLWIKSKSHLISINVLLWWTNSPIRFIKNFDFDINNIVKNSITSLLWFDLVNNKLYTVLNNSEIWILDVSKYIKAEYNRTQKFKPKDSVFLSSLNYNNNNIWVQCKKTDWVYKCMWINNYVWKIWITDQIALWQFFNRAWNITKSSSFIVGSNDFTDNTSFWVINSNNTLKLDWNKNKFAVYKDTKWVKITLIGWYTFKYNDIARNHLLWDNWGLITTDNANIVAKFWNSSIWLLKITIDPNTNNFVIKELFNWKPLSNPLLINKKSVDLTNHTIYFIDDWIFKNLDFWWAKQSEHIETYKLWNWIADYKQSRDLQEDSKNYFKNLKSWNNINYVYNSNWSMLVPVINNNRIVKLILKQWRTYNLTKLDFMPYVWDINTTSQNWINHFLINIDWKFGYSVANNIKRISLNKIYKLWKDISNSKNFAVLMEDSKYLSNLKSIDNSHYVYNNSAWMFKPIINSNNIISSINTLKWTLSSYTTKTDFTPYKDNYNTSQNWINQFYINSDWKLGYSNNNPTVQISRWYTSTWEICVNSVCHPINNWYTQAFKLWTWITENTIDWYDKWLLAINGSNNTYIAYKFDNNWQFTWNVVDITDITNNSLNITGNNLDNTTTTNSQVWKN